MKDASSLGGAKTEVVPSLKCEERYCSVEASRAELRREKKNMGHCFLEFLSARGDRWELPEWFRRLVGFVGLRIGGFLPCNSKVEDEDE